MAQTTHKPDGTVTFELTIASGAIADSYKKVLARVAQSAEIRGFRKGKAPIDLVEKSLDKSKLYSQVVEEVLPDAYVKQLTSDKIEPLIEPRITPVAMEEGKDWKFKVETATRPEVDLGKYEDYIKKSLKEHAKKHPEDPKAKPEEARDHKLGVIFDALLGNAKVDISDLLVEEEAKSALGKLINQLNSLRLTVDDYAKSIKKTRDELIAEYRKTATANLKLEFILQALIKEKDPKVADDEISALKPPKGQEYYAKYVIQKRKVLDFLYEL